MQGHQSNNSTFTPLDSKIERTIRKRPKDNPDSEEEEEFKEKEEELKVGEPMAEQLVNQPPLMRQPMKNAFIPKNLDQPSCIAHQPKV